MSETLQIRTYGNPHLPAVIYLPGLHGDWTLIGSFRAALRDRAFFVEMTYPRSLTWSIEDYAEAVEAELVSREITHGWLLGESFGSQVAWGLLKRDLNSTQAKLFKIDGIIFAGGFVKHPFKWGPPALGWLGKKTPKWLHRLELKTYARYAKFRHRNASAVLNNIEEFVNRRTELDRQAMGHRLRLLDDFDPRPIAKKANLPIYYLAGFIDPLIPWVLVRHWLGKNCPGYRHGITIWTADHNVLAAAPVRSADIVMNWIKNHAVENNSKPKINCRELATIIEEGDKEKK